LFLDGTEKRICAIKELRHMNPIATDLDYLIPVHRLACMEHLQRLVATGYFYWHAGTVHFTKAAGFLQKMRAYYPIEATPGQRAVAQRKHRANVHLLMYPDPSRTGYILWFLLATLGRRKVDPVTGVVDAAAGFIDFIFERERMKDARQVPLTWLGYYELGQFEAPADRRKKQGAKRTWTWRLTRSNFSEWDARLTIAAQAGLSILHREFRPILTSPMFAGVRRDVVLLEQRAEASFHKQHPRSAYRSPIAVPLPYVCRVKVFQDSTLLSMVERLGAEDADAKARARAAAEAALSGVEPPNHYTQSLTMMKERSDGFAEEEDGDGSV
jgi:hypothetical protein